MVESKWISVPWCIGGGLVAYRKSWFDAIGYTTFPDTWEELQDAGKKLKAKGTPVGQALSHSFGDPPGFWYPWLWSFGGKEVEADGKTVALNSKETLESVKAAVPFWNEACDPGGLAWDDSSNNRAFLSGTICCTNNGASIYIEAKQQAGHLPDRERHADVQRHPACPAAQGSRRPVQPARPVHRHGHGLFAKSGCGQGHS